MLQIALEEAEERKEQLPITRVYDELANTYYQKGDVDEAEKLFRLVVKRSVLWLIFYLFRRLLEMHGKRDSDPEFIGISLKLADIFARRGLLDNAESGYKHCLRKQMQVNSSTMIHNCISGSARTYETIFRGAWSTNGGSTYCRYVRCHVYGSYRTTGNDVGKLCSLSCELL